MIKLYGKPIRVNKVYISLFSVVFKLIYYLDRASVLKKSMLCNTSFVVQLTWEPADDFN